MLQRAGMQTRNLVLMFSLSLLAPLGCDDADTLETSSAEVLGADVNADLCNDIGLLRDALIGLAADPALAALAHETALAAGDTTVVLGDLRAAAEAHGLNIEAQIEASILDRGGSDQEVLRTLTLFAETEDATLLHNADLELSGALLGGDGISTPPTWLVSYPLIEGSDCSFEELGSDAVQGARKQSWSEFCGDMGLDVCYDQPFYYCCNASNL